VLATPEQTFQYYCVTGVSGRSEHADGLRTTMGQMWQTSTSLPQEHAQGQGEIRSIGSGAILTHGVNGAPVKTHRGMMSTDVRAPGV
jgi:hypothetical protein